MIKKIWTKMQNKRQFHTLTMLRSMIGNVVIRTLRLHHHIIRGEEE